MAKKTTATASSPLQVAEMRLSAIRKDMAAQNLDALYISHLPSVRYLTNFSGSNAVLVITGDAVLFFTDDRYTEQVKTEVYPINGLQTHIERDPLGYMQTNNSLKGCKTIGFDPTRLTYAAVTNIRKNLKGIATKRASGLVEKQTMRKAPHEAAIIRKAADIQTQVFQAILPMITPGIRECDLAAEITYQGRKLGADKDSFDIIAVAGDHSAWVHGRATERVINKGEMITFDFGFYYQGFASDVTRTVACGEPGDEARAVYEVVRSAHGAAIAAAKAGMTGKELDDVARTIITDAGYGQYFQHSLGHGLGIEVHESPAVAQKNTKGIIPAGAVVTIEPGIYLPGKFGVRIEDDVWITETGCEILSSGSSELIVL